MTYELHAVIGGKTVLESACLSLKQTKVVVLNEPSLALVPVTSELREELEATGGGISPSLDYSIFDRLKPAIAGWVAALSSDGVIAYVEAEFFGGSGGQSAVVWDKGRIVFGPVLTKWGMPGDRREVQSGSEMAINQALRLLGVGTDSRRDEFDMVGLGQARRTERW